MAIPSSECGDACWVRALALACLTAARGSRRVVRSSPLGVAPGDGAIRRVGYRAQKHPVLRLLSFVDLLFFEMARATAHCADNTDAEHRKTRRGGFQSAPPADRKLPLVSIIRALVAVCSVAGLFHTRDRK